MAVTKPYYRTVRQFTDGSYAEGGRSFYIVHPSYASESSNYIRAFLLIQKDLQSLFEYIEPSDQNLDTYSFRTYELLLRTCTEIEANFKAIFRANTYSRSTSNLNIFDYVKVDRSHFLSDYAVKMPYWSGAGNVRRPFEAWKQGHSLTWYQAYNSSKHDRAQELKAATLDNLVEAYGGLSIVLAAQFFSYDFGPADAFLSTGTFYGDHEYEESIGQYARIRYPSNLPSDGRYEFKWPDLRNSSEPFQRFNYDVL
jgi:hypothetical protein